MKLALTAAAVVAMGCGRLQFDDQTRSDGAGDAVSGDSLVMPPNPQACPPFTDPGTRVFNVANVTDLLMRISTAAAGDSIRLAAGDYVLTQPLTITTPIVLRSASLDATSVTLRGDGTFTPVLYIRGSSIRVASLTVTGSSSDIVMVEPGGGVDTSNVAFYDVTFADGPGARLRIRPLAGNVAGPFADNGTVSCSRLIPTGAAGCSDTVTTWGISADAARGWTIANNVFDWRSCPAPSFRTVTFDTGSRDTVITDNMFIATNHSILLGGDSPSRTYADPIPTGCSGTIEHWGGLVCNNLIAGVGVPPDADADFEEGVAAWSTCDAWIMHNTIVSPSPAETFTSLEYRFAGTLVHLVNNVVVKAALQRDLGVQDTTYEASNYIYSSLAELRDAAGGDLHFAGTPPTGASIAGLQCTTDAAGKARNQAAPAVGAFEP